MLEWGVRYLEAVGAYLGYLGIPGLFFIALLDSTAVPLVGGPEALISLLSYQSPSKALLVACVGAAGSTLGCVILYHIARAGGQVVLKKIPAAKLARVVRLVERNAAWGVFLAVILPPPFPTKPVILAAGVFRAPLVRFTAAVFAGRTIRYSALAYLAARFGADAARILRDRYPWFLAAIAAAIVAVLTVRRYRRPAA
jgi:membrane protein YqaA with SNARE-associated domain